jgi:glycosyltransferase involved in cell wall biosynthesis
VIKILQICNKAPYPANDGSSIAIYNMARGLIEVGIDLHLLAINTKKNFKPDESVPESFRQKSHYRSVYRNTDVSFAGAFANLFTGKSYFVSRFYFSEFEEALISALKSDTYDIVQLEGLFMAVYIPVIRVHSKAKIVLRAHNIEHVIWMRHIAGERSLLKKWYLSLQNRRLKKFELSAFNQVDAVVPITQNDEENIRLMGCRVPLYTCITGINPSEYRATTARAQKKDSVFYFGSMDWMPNQEAVTWFLQNCWERIKEKAPQARFIIAGRGMPLHFFHINRPGVTIIEEVEDPREFFRQHQVMVVPLWSGSGLRIKIVEGMASGKAIVSTTIGAEGINYTHGKNIFIADTPDDFVKYTGLLLSDEKLRDEMGKEAAAHAAKDFDNLTLVSRLVVSFRSLLHA